MASVCSFVCIAPYLDLCCAPVGGDRNREPVIEHTRPPTVSLRGCTAAFYTGPDTFSQLLACK